MDVKILSSSSEDLCYIISGAENNAVWKVYITFANGINPDFYIDKTGGNAGEK